jgi:hypothetical protein
VKVGSSIVLAVLLELRKSIENNKKSEKYKPNFVGFLVTNPTTFLKHVHGFS